jgi:hypothetical protein
VKQKRETIMTQQELNAMQPRIWLAAEKIAGDSRIVQENARKRASARLERATAEFAEATAQVNSLTPASSSAVPHRHTASASALTPRPAVALPTRPTLTARELLERNEAILSHPLASGRHETFAIGLCSGDFSSSTEQVLAVLEASHSQDELDEISGRATVARVLALHRGETPKASGLSVDEAQYVAKVVDLHNRLTGRVAKK